MRDINSYTRKQLLELPIRARENAPTAYDTLLLVPTRKKHDSGWHVIAIIGVNDEPVEIASYCDDINWCIELPARYPNRDYPLWNMRTDMTYPAGVVHMWVRDAEFVVGGGYSSTEVIVRKRIVS